MKKKTALAVLFIGCSAANVQDAKMKTSPAYDNVRHDRERDQDLAPDTYRQYERTEKSGAGQYGGYHKVQFKKNATPGDTSDFLKRPTFKARRPTY